MSQAAIVVLAGTDTHADFARVFNALEAAKEFDEAGDDVQLIFDGAGTTWPPILADPDHEAHEVFESVRHLITGACGFCAQSFEVADELKELEIEFLDDFEGHPSLKSLVDDNYEVITF